MKTTATMFLCLGLAVGLTVPGSLRAGQNPDASTNKTAKDSSKKDDNSRPSAQDIANAKSQGLVWVNTSTRVFHKEGENYGKTKRGKFMTEAEARQQGFRPAKESASVKPAPRKDQSGLDSSANTHNSTPPKP